MDRTIYEACHGLIKEFQHHTISPDEILATKTDNLLPIPFKTRDELSEIAKLDNDEGLYQGELLPHMDLKVLHYFLTQLCLNRYPQLINSMDETSLITIGLLVEKWVQDFIVSKKSKQVDEFDTYESDSESASESESESRSDSSVSSHSLSDTDPNDDSEGDGDEAWRVRRGVVEMMAQLNDWDHTDEEEV